MNNFSDEEILEFLEKMKSPHIGWEEKTHKMIMLGTVKEFDLANKCVELGFMKKNIQIFIQTINVLIGLIFGLFFNLKFSLS